MLEVDSQTNYTFYIPNETWNPLGKKQQGRPKMTLRITFEGDFKKMELTWGTAER